MMTIMINSLREKMRNKTIYVIGGIGIFIITLLMLNADFSFDDRKIISFEELVPMAIIMVNFLASILAVMLSLQTIPNEFERKTTHLVLVRGIKKYEYMLGLTLSNIIVSLISLYLLFISIVIFCMIHGKWSYTLNILGSMSILSINIAVLSALTSLISIRIPLFVNGILGILIYFLGAFHNLLAVFAGVVGGVAGKFLNIILVIIPNFSSVQREAGNLMSGKMIELYPIIFQMFFLYIVTTLILFTFRKEV